ncbi:MAG TPA: bifunctional 4-hydroxy-2-oxoglutarate aldolase/2-dehydro-3-deoxy-phosphogluconate aldolase [Phycisphaerae bacterium]|nr:bifunctional 4-hydroxy-2-oxoglutarate aldolase/2-dehydro-3-deoxy-phosphogluconate aldolase [Phycisphaerae bacterium]
MMRDEVLKTLCDVGIVPVVRAKSADALADIAKALLEGGVPITEVTMTVPGAIDGIRRLVETFGSEVLVGVGSVTDPLQADEAMDAGAQFVVGPVLVPEVIVAANARDTVVIPGAYSATEVFQAHTLGADVVKIFPAGVGGPAYFKALLAPMPFLKLMPTGGVDLKTAGAFIKAGAVTLGAGSALVEKQAVADGDWARITDLARRFRDEVEKARAE